MAPRTNKAAQAATAAPKEKVEPVAEKKPVPAEVDIHQYIPVKNGFHGMLIYVSKRTGEVYRWERFDDEQEIELQELKNAKSADKKFFTNNWFMFDDDYLWVTEYLGVGAFYRNALKQDQYEELFRKTPAEIKATVSKLTKGQKASLAYYARQVIADGGIDSNKAIAALEESLGVALIEH